MARHSVIIALKNSPALAASQNFAAIYRRAGQMKPQTLLEKEEIMGNVGAKTTYARSCQRLLGCPSPYLALAALLGAEAYPRTECKGQPNPGPDLPKLPESVLDPTYFWAVNTQEF